MHRDLLRRAVCAVLCAVSLILSGCAKAPGEEPFVLPADGSVTHNRRAYVPREDLTTVLIMGLDKYERPEELKGYTNKMQSDFLLLLILDETEMICQALHLNRDTMTEIRRLGVGGGVSGKFQGQLALAHTYGSGGSDSSLNAVKAVSTLLGGVKIDHYLTLTMDAVAVVNDLLGGVTVTVLDDFTDIDPELAKGKTVTLRGEQALTYVRTRYGVGDSTNLSRMERQRQYLDAFYAKLMEKNAEDEGFLADTLMAVNDSFMSDCSVTALEDLGELMSQCTLGQIHTLPGEAVVGEEYMEFYVNQEALRELVIRLFYHPKAETLP